MLVSPWSRAWRPCVLALLGVLRAVSPVGAQLTIAPAYSGSYSAVDLGSVPSLPTNYGGLTFKAGDPGTIIIGGAANGAAGELYSIAVVRDGSQHITGFSGTATLFADGAYNDGGLAYGPGGVLFYARYPVGELGQIKPGSTITDKIVNLVTAGVNQTAGGFNFVPPGYPGAGQAKLVTYPGGYWWTLGLTPDGQGTYDVSNPIQKTTIPGGPEGFIYVPPGSPLFADYDSMLVSEYAVGKVAAYSIDADGDPEPASRVDFITGLGGAEGAVIDPLTGDFLFSTYGGGSRVVAVRGFAAPTTTTTSTTTSTTSSTTTTSTSTSSTTVTTTSATTSSTTSSTSTTSASTSTATTSTTTSTTSSTTTTATTHPSTTTTTVPPGCERVQTLAAINCRLAALIALVQTSGVPAEYVEPIVRRLAKAKERKEMAEEKLAAGRIKPTQNMLKQAGTQLARLVDHLASRRFRKGLSEAFRATLTAEADELIEQLRAIRKGLHRKT